MNKKIIVTLVVLLFCISCISLVSADNSTNETLESNESETVDMSNYIVPISITGDGIEFSDGFTGFCLDSTKKAITTGDGFTSQSTGSDETQNYAKLAIIEAYRQGCEDNLAQIMAYFADGSYKTSNNEVIVAVLESQETVGDSAVVELEDSIEGDFEFELLKDVNGEKSDCLAYKVSLKEIPNDDKLGAADDENVTEEADDAPAADNSTDDEQAAGTSDDNKTDDGQSEAADDNQSQETVVNETNKTIINKTNTVNINENNTTTINVNNNKVINKTNDAPQNATIPQKLMKAAGNPITILIAVIVIVAIAGAYMRRKGN